MLSNRCFTSLDNHCEQMQIQNAHPYRYEPYDPGASASHPHPYIRIRTFASVHPQHSQTINTVSSTRFCMDLCMHACMHAMYVFLSAFYHPAPDRNRRRQRRWLWRRQLLSLCARSAWSDLKRREATRCDRRHKSICVWSVTTKSVSASKWARVTIIEWRSEHFHHIAFFYFLYYRRCRFPVLKHDVVGWFCVPCVLISMRLHVPARARVYAFITSKKKWLDLGLDLIWLNGWSMIDETKQASKQTKSDNNLFDFIHSVIHSFIWSVGRSVGWW